MIVKLNDNNFDKEVTQGLVLADFYAEWCGPCKMLQPVLEELSKKEPELKIVKVDVDQHSDIAREFGIMSVPTLLIFKDGTLVKKQVGYLSLEELAEPIEKNK